MLHLTGIESGREPERHDMSDAAMVDRVAKALYGHIGWHEGANKVRAGSRWFTKEDYDPDLAWTLCCEEAGEEMRFYLEHARRAIAAMREAT